MRLAAIGVGVGEAGVVVQGGGELGDGPFVLAALQMTQTARQPPRQCRRHRPPVRRSSSASFFVGVREVTLRWLSQLEPEESASSPTTYVDLSVPTIQQLIVERGTAQRRYAERDRLRQLRVGEPNQSGDGGVLKRRSPS